MKKKILLILSMCLIMLGLAGCGEDPTKVDYNGYTYEQLKGAFVCPITNTNKKHPFHIELDERTQTTGVILCDQAKMLDVGARNALFKEECPEDLWNEAKELIISFM